MLSDFSLAHWLSLHALVILIALLTYVMTSHVMHQRRQPAAAIEWILFMVLLPYFALPAFLVFGSRKLARRPVSVRPPAQEYDGTGAWAVDPIAALGQPAPAACDDLVVHRDGRTHDGVPSRY